MEEQSSSKQHTMLFTGSGGEYFKIWIVNVLLSIVTLGIYSAWAKVRTNRYFYGNTYLDGSPFEYHATPQQILLGRMIAIALFIVYVLTSELMPLVSGVLLLVLLAVTPWIIYRSLRFTMRMSSYRNVRFGFSGRVGPMYKYMFLWPIIPMFVLGVIAVAFDTIGMPDALVSVVAVLAFSSLYLSFPWVQQSITQYVMSHYRYGQGQFAVNPALSVKKYYGVYLIAFLLFLLASAFIVAVIYAMGMFDVVQSLQESQGNIDPSEAQAILPMLSVIYGGLFLFGFLIKAYTGTAIRNYVFARTQLDDIAQFKSTFSVGSLLVLMVTNFILLIVSLGFAYPWIKVRSMRYVAEHTCVQVEGDATQYLSQQQSKTSAIGEEMGDAFDVDMDLGI
jgi:uncharacterized membrane protein YjgN (DUF898 family)